MSYGLGKVKNVNWIFNEYFKEFSNAQGETTLILNTKKYRQQFNAI